MSTIWTNRTSPPMLADLVVASDRISSTPAARPQARGKFIFAGDEKVYVRGVVYGAFRPDPSGREYTDLDTIERDFAQMAAHGINTVRIPHTSPPRSLLDIAARHGLWVMAGLSAEQYLGFLIDRKKRLSDIESLVREKAQACAGHPALLCYALGNEIPAPIARWLGRSKIERYLEHLYRAVNAEDPGALVTYVNYPTTEYLELPFLDLLCFNVYLESQEKLEDYLGRLQNIAAERPLIMSELGLDSLRNGEDSQARSLDWQIRTAFAAGCAGVFLFSWTDEWYRAHDVDDWAFGLTRADRSAKPALRTARQAFSEVPFASEITWPRISVIVCSYNGARTIRTCLERLRTVAYPNYEVIVVDDGSRDATATIAREFDCRLIQTENRGLASARNTGLEAATGEIVAYIDDDAYPDEHWLTYLASAFRSTSHVGIGGPNLAPPGDGEVADAVARSPGGPVHVLLSDREAEHIPGCNMAFRANRLREIGGFDPQFRAAGDDVDLCWRLMERSWTLGYSAAAQVWHHRRRSIGAYWRQQSGYGRAEALLERKWPEKYNGIGHANWVGRLYGPGLHHLLKAGRIYHGQWGSAPYQSLYQPTPTTFWSLAATPEWVFVICALAALSLLGALWQPLIFAMVPFALALAIPVIQAGLAAARATLPQGASPGARIRLRLLVAFFHLVQPLARLRGRLQLGLAPWRRVSAPELSAPLPRTATVWSKRWRSLDDRLVTIEAAFKAAGAATRRGGDYERWDLEVSGGALGAARLLAAAEDHPAGAQLLRFRWWPRCSYPGVAATAAFAALAGGAMAAHAWVAAAILGTLTLLLAFRIALECAGAAGTISRALKSSGSGET